MKNFEQIDKQFHLGNETLNIGRYAVAIEMYDDLIHKLKAYEGDSNAQKILEATLNNRGCAKCKEALRKKNELALYESGVRDFKRAIKASGVTDRNELSVRTAYKNLLFAKKEMEELDLATGIELEYLLCY